MSKIEVKLSNHERETVFYYNEAEKIAIVDTYNVKLQQKLAEYAEKYPDECKFVAAHDWGNQRYDLPKTWIKVVPPRQLTPEERKKRSAAMHELRAKMSEEKAG